MPIEKAREHALDGACLELLREGELRCVETTVVSDRETAAAVRDARYERYAIQRLATAVGIFTREPSPEAIVVRVAPCPHATDNAVHPLSGESAPAGFQ